MHHLRPVTIVAEPAPAEELAVQFCAGGGWATATLKKELFAILWVYFRPFREKREQIRQRRLNHQRGAEKRRAPMA